MRRSARWRGRSSAVRRTTAGASYQIVITRCVECGRATQRGRGEELAIDPAAVEAAECDAQKIDLREAPKTMPRAAQEIPPATRRFVIHRDGGHCVVPGCQNSAYVDLHHLELR